jgi:hypothetical protein
MDNKVIAAKLREAAERLEERGDAAFRSAAFLGAAESAEACPTPLQRLYERHGPAALEALPGVGRGIAGAIAEMLITGRWRYLERLRESERAFTYLDDEGIEHECVVLEPGSRSRLHGRDAIAALLRGALA